MLHQRRIMLVSQLMQKRALQLLMAPARRFQDIAWANSQFRSSMERRIDAESIFGSDRHTPIHHNTGIHFSREKRLGKFVHGVVDMRRRLVARFTQPETRLLSTIQKNGRLKVQEENPFE